MSGDLLNINNQACDVPKWHCCGISVVKRTLVVLAIDNYAFREYLCTNYTIRTKFWLQMRTLLKSRMCFLGAVDFVHLELYYQATHQHQVVTGMYRCIKEWFNCKTRMPGTVKCRPTVAYWVQIDGINIATELITRYYLNRTLIQCCFNARPTSATLAQH